mmetsp:Transcript_26947/g.31830  ORF Transcript_26947/g.31830 Transcript_26947/m.31830 type:complete len:264 (+) Transcript_26947:285-1076(+)
MEQFDVLRREATKLERSLEDKIARYHQLAQRLTSGGMDPKNSLVDGSHNSAIHQRLSPGTTNNNPSSTTNPNMFSEEEEANLSKEINRTLSLLSDLINTKMAPAAERTSKSQQHSLLVKRYREILFDSTADFQKTANGLSRRREQLQLFRGAAAAIQGNGSGEGGGDEEDPAMEHLMRERNSIQGAMDASHSVIGQAAEVEASLRSQGGALRGVSGTVLRMASQIPGLDGLIDQIRRKRNKDDFIVSGVIAVCILFTLWYLFG